MSMRSPIGLRFRPSLIIFVDEAGERICQQFKRIIDVTDFDPLLHQSIALLQVADGNDRAHPVPVGKEFPPDEDIPREEDTLEHLVDTMLRDVQRNKRVVEIIEAGYPVPNPRTQVYIVGSAQDPWMAQVLQIVNAQVAKKGFTTLTCFILSTYEKGQSAIASPSDTTIVGEDMPTSLSGGSFWAEREVANFCYLYEDMLTYPVPTFVTEAESDHAAAEALFTLAATGITPEPVFEEMMKVGPTLNTYENVGTLSTSMIIFPREAILEYCSSRLAVALTSQWIRDLNDGVLPEQEHEKLQNRARGVANRIEQWIYDGPLRPYANSQKRLQEIQRKAKQNTTNTSTQKSLLDNANRWPSLAILDGGEQRLLKNAAHSSRSVTDHKRILRRLIEETEELFLLFWSEDINNETNRQKRRLDGWTKLVFQQEGKAVEAYQEWDKAATDAWAAVKTRVNAEVKQIIDQLWSAEDNGFEVAATYVDELDDRLATLADRLGRLRESHERDYEDALNEFERKADGEWVTHQNATSIIGSGQGTAQAGPTMSNQPIANQGPADGAIVGSNVPSQTSTSAYHHLPTREEHIARHLEQRITWLQNQVPSLPTQVTVSIPFLFSLVLSGMALFPNVMTTPITAGLTVGTGAIIATGNGYFRWFYQKRVEEAKEDLLTFYRIYYAHRCEQREDKLRTIVTGPLRRSVQSIRERLDNIRLFVNDLQNTLDKRATNVQHKLFSGPSGVRDIFVANGERLQKDHHTLEDIAAQITKLRLKEPVEEWHRTPQDMKQHLIQTFRQMQESILEMGDEQAQQHIYAFAAEIICAYFKGDFVNIQLALDKPEIWRDVLDRAENPLYRTQVGTRDPKLLFVCGRESDINMGIHYLRKDAHPVYVSNHHDWLLVAAFFSGGLPLALDANTLFPLKEGKKPSSNMSFDASEDILPAFAGLDKNDL